MFEGERGFNLVGAGAAGAELGASHGLFGFANLKGRRATGAKTLCFCLELLLRNAGHVVHRQELLRSVWGSVSNAASNNLDVAMSALRNKVDCSSGRKLIQTVRGFGYKISET